jgi:hypothetical protein
MVGYQTEKERFVIGTIDNDVFYFNPSDRTIYKVNGKNLVFASKQLDKKFKFDKAIIFNETIYFFKGAQDSKTKLHHLYVQTMNANNLVLNGTFESVYEMEYLGKKSRACNIDFYFSPDKSKMLVSCHLLDRKPYDVSFAFTSISFFHSIRESKLLNASYAVYDVSGELFSKNTGMKTDINYPLTIADYAIDNSGTVYMAGITNFDTKNYERAARKVFVIQTSPEGDVTPAEIILPQSKYPENVSVIVNNQAQLFATGYYTANKMDNMLGLFSATMDVTDFTEKEAVVSEFTEEFLTRFLDAKDANSVMKDLNKGSDFEKYGYSVYPLQLLSDGTPVMTIVKNYTLTMTTRTQNGSQTTYYHHYGDIITANFQTDGEPKWVAKIPRDVNYVNAAPYGNVGVAIDADNQVNLFYTLMESVSFPLTFTKTSDAKLMKYSITTDGQESYVEVYDSKKSKMAAIPGEMVVLPELSKIMMTGNKGEMFINWFFMSIPNE